MHGRAQETRREARARAFPVVALAAVIAIAATLAACGADSEPKTPQAQTDSGPPREQRASFLARMIPAVTTTAASTSPAAGSAAALASDLSVERKVAQLFLFGFPGTDLSAGVFGDLSRLDLGGIVIDRGNYTDPGQVAALATEATAVAEREGHIPPWVIVPQEGGRFNAFADLPPATAPADLSSDDQATSEAEQATEALRSLGVNGVLAPVADVGPADGLALGARARSDDPREVAGYVTSTIGAYRAGRVLTAAGHFPGLGSGTEDTRYGLSQVGASLDELRERDLIPFRAAIRAGVPAIVVSNGLYVTNDFVTPGTLSHELTTELLRDELGFEGIAITDDLSDPGVTSLTSVSDAAVKAVGAGADMVYVSGPPSDQRAAYIAVLRAVRSGEISAERLDQALLRILAIKRDYGLID